MTPYRNIARVAKAHGSKGEVVVAALRGLPFALRRGMRVSLTPPAFGRDRFVGVASISGEQGDTAIVRFTCCQDLSDAEGIVGCYVLARREDLDLGALDAPYEDLIGREVVDARHGEIGVISEVMEGPANDVWVISGGRYGEVLLPVVEQVVPSIPDEGPIAVSAMDGIVPADADGGASGAPDGGDPC